MSILDAPEGTLNLTDGRWVYWELLIRVGQREVVKEAVRDDGRWRYSLTGTRVVSDAAAMATERKDSQGLGVLIRWKEDQSYFVCL